MAVSLGPGEFDFRTRINQYHSTSQSRTPPGAVSDNRLGRRFHPPVGGASRASGLPRAAAGRLVAGGSPDPLCGQRPNGREKKIGSAIARTAILLTRRCCPGPSREKTNTITTPAWPCEPPVCLDCGRGRVPAPPKVSRPDLGRCSPSLERGHSPSWALCEGQKKSRRKPWRFCCARAVTSARSAGGFRDPELTLFWGTTIKLTPFMRKRTWEASDCRISCDAFSRFCLFTRFQQLRNCAA